jgi:hypothetical protein
LLGTQKGSSPGQFDGPWGVAFDHQDQVVIVADGYNRRLQFFSRTKLKHLKSFGSEGTRLGFFADMLGLCVQPFTRHLLVCDGNRIQVISPQEGKGK